MSDAIDDITRLSLRQLRIFDAVARVDDVAREMGVHAPNVYRLEREGALATASVTTLEKYLDALGFELCLVALPKRARATHATMSEPFVIVDPRDAIEHEEPEPRRGPSPSPRRK